MSKRNKIIYWIATAWLALGMLSTGLAQLIRPGSEADFMVKLGYPAYVATLLGVWKLLGVPVILLPRLPLLKEWAYAGFFFAMSGAIFSHVGAGQPSEMFPAALLLALTIVSWAMRPADRRLSSSIQPQRS